MGEGLIAISFYDISVEPFLQTLDGVAGFLARGRSHCEASKIDLKEIVETRLHPDMQAFRFQIWTVVRLSRGVMRGVQKGVFDVPVLPPYEMDYAELQNLVAEGYTELKELTRVTVDAFEGKEVLLDYPNEGQLAPTGEALRLPFTAEGFVISAMTPNLYFHATTAYDILRMKGVPLGKRDYLGTVRMKSWPGPHKLLATKKAET